MTLTNQGRWYQFLQPVTATVECDGQPHRVTWRRGRLVLEDHDLTAERTMLVFGGELCVCMRVLELWRQQFGMPPEAFSRMDSWLGANAFLAPPEFARPRELGMVVSWERSWRQSAHIHHKPARLLQDQLKEHALRPLREHLNFWKAEGKARMVSSVEVKVVPSHQTPTLEGRVEGISMRAAAKLGGRWVVDVWGRGAAVVEGAFVLEVVESHNPEEMVVRAVRWRRGGGGFEPFAARATARRSDDGWHLQWGDDPVR